jgi:hypothetical protein
MQQQNDVILVFNLLNRREHFTLHTFHGEEKQWQLIISQKKIIIPQSLQKRVVDWYHLHLCHPGATCTEANIKNNISTGKI